MTPFFCATPRTTFSQIPVRPPTGTNGQQVCLLSGILPHVLEKKGRRLCFESSSSRWVFEKASPFSLALACDWFSLLRRLVIRILSHSSLDPGVCTRACPETCERLPRKRRVCASRSLPLEKKANCGRLRLSLAPLYLAPLLRPLGCFGGNGLPSSCSLSQTLPRHRVLKTAGERRAVPLLPRPNSRNSFFGNACFVSILKIHNCMYTHIHLSKYALFYTSTYACIYIIDTLVHAHVYVALFVWCGQVLDARFAC